MDEPLAGRLSPAERRSSRQGPVTVLGRERPGAPRGSGVVPPGGAVDELDEGVLHLGAGLGLVVNLVADVG